VAALGRDGQAGGETVTGLMVEMKALLSAKPSIPAAADLAAESLLWQAVLTAQKKHIFTRIAVPTFPRMRR
jgi:hypothetical protein